MLSSRDGCSGRAREGGEGGGVHGCPTELHSLCCLSASSQVADGLGGVGWVGEKGADRSSVVDSAGGVSSRASAEGRSANLELFFFGGA